MPSRHYLRPFVEKQPPKKCHFDIAYGSGDDRVKNNENQDNTSNYPIRGMLSTYIISDVCLAVPGQCQVVPFIDRIHVISSNYLDNCHGLKYIILPDTLKIIGNNAFADCRKLEIEIAILQVWFVDDNIKWLK